MKCAWMFLGSVVSLFVTEVLIFSFFPGLEEEVERLGGPSAYVEAPVVRIDRRKKTVTTEDGRTIAYSKLVLAETLLNYD